MNEFSKKFWLIVVFFATILFLSSSVSFSQEEMRKKRIHAFLGADTPHGVEKALVKAFNRAFKGSPHEFVLIQADSAENDLLSMEQTFANTPDGFLFFLHNIDEKININNIISQASVAATPLVFVGRGEHFTDVQQRYTAFSIGQKEIARGVTSELQRNDIQNALCVASVINNHCTTIRQMFSGEMLLRQVNLQVSVSENWATIVSALTQNPKINHVFIADQASIDLVMGALKLLNTPITYSLISNEDIIAIDDSLVFSIDPQWYLLSTLAVQSLMVRIEEGQELWINLSVSPKVRRY